MLRPDLRDALKNAEHLKCAILVTSVCRLGRDLRVYDILVERGIPVWVVGEGKIDRSELKARLRAARDWLARRALQAIAANVKKSPAERKKSVPNLPHARRRGTLINAGRAEERDMKMFGIFDVNPVLLDASRKDLAQALNISGNFNIVDQFDRQEPWTERSVGRLRQRYRQHLQEQLELDDWDNAGGFG